MRFVFVSNKFKSISQNTFESIQSNKKIVKSSYERQNKTKCIRNCFDH